MSMDVHLPPAASSTAAPASSAAAPASSAAAPASSSSSVSGPATAGVAVTGVAALFGLMLAQSIKQGAPSPAAPTAKAAVRVPVSAAADATIAAGTSTVFAAGTSTALASPQQIKSLTASGSALSTKDKKKAAAGSAATIASAVSAAGITPVLVIIPNEPLRAVAQASVLPASSVKAMDTAVITPSELLSTNKGAKQVSSTQATAEVQESAPQGASSAETAETNIIVPNEPAATNVFTESEETTQTPVSAILPAVPTLAAQSSQAVLVSAATKASGAQETIQADSMQQSLARPSTASVSSSATRSAAPVSSLATRSAASISAAPVSAGLGSPVSVSQTSALQNTGPASDNPPVTAAGKNTGSVMGEKAVSGAVRKDAPAGAASKSEDVTQGGSAALADPATTASGTLSSTASALPVATGKQVVQQVSSGIQSMTVQSNGSGQKQITLQLHPADLGKIQVSVTMTPITQVDGKITTQVAAHVVTEQPNVKDALQSHQADLRQSLKEAGLSLDRLTVTVQSSSAGAQAGLGDSRQNARSGGNETASFQPSSAGAGAQGGALGSGSSFSSFAAFAQNHQARPGVPESLSLQTQPAEESAAGITPAQHLISNRVDTHA